MYFCSAEASEKWDRRKSIGLDSWRSVYLHTYTQSGKSVHRLFETQITMGRRVFGKSEKSVQFNVN